LSVDRGEKKRPQPKDFPPFKSASKSGSKKAKPGRSARGGDAYGMTPKNRKGSFFTHSWQEGEGGTPS